MIMYYPGAIVFWTSNNGGDETPMNIKFVIVHFSRAILLYDARRGQMCPGVNVLPSGLHW